MADIVKLIYKGDEMAQGGGSTDLPITILPLNGSSDIAWAQAILDAVLAGKFVILKDTTVSWLDRYFYLSEKWSTRLRFFSTQWSRGDGTTTESVHGEQTWHYIQEWGIYINYSGTTVTNISQPADFEVWVSWWTS